MKCPICYGKVLKDANRCIECGFDLSKLKSFSNKEVKTAKHEYRNEEIIMSNVMPYDVKKKKFILLLIFLGVFGAHNFYVNKNFKAIIMLTFSALLLITSNLIYAAVPLSFLSNLNITTTISILGAISFLLWLSDIFCVIFKKFTYPVVEVK